MHLNNMVELLVIEKACKAWVATLPSINVKNQLDFFQVMFPHEPLRQGQVHQACTSNDRQHVFIDFLEITVISLNKLVFYFDSYVLKHLSGYLAEKYFNKI